MVGKVMEYQKVGKLWRPKGLPPTEGKPGQMPTNGLSVNWSKNGLVASFLSFIRARSKRWWAGGQGRSWARAQLMGDVGTVEDILIKILVHVKQRKRAALIICLTNDKVKQISDAVKSEFPDINIYKYTDDDEQLPTEFVGPMDVIFSTNYAGRGTDIKTNAELEANGGLHVIVTFMPRNSRVERQAFGRTARQGKKGTAQLILTEVDLDEDLIDQNKDQQSQLETLDPIFETDQHSWISKICGSILVHVKQRKRAALIICLTNDKVKQISDAVKSEFPDINIYKYTDDDEQLPTDFVGPMDVIFSTNYAGRGTDIKTNAELEANGGLHVIVTFMPRNSRVERQAFGHTEKGTAQLIFNECEKDKDLFDQNMDILAKRDQLIEQSFEKAKKEVLPKLFVKERLFEKFSTFIEEIRESTANAVGGNEQILAQIEEHWGFWLREKVEMRDVDAPMPSEAVLISELDAFIVEERQKGSPPPRRPPPPEFRPFGGASFFSLVFAPMMAHALNGSSSRFFEAPFLGLSLFTNPSYLVLKGYKLDYGNAIKHLEKAIELDVRQSGFAAPAHYYMALALVKKGDDISVDKREARVEHQHKAAEHLQKASELINQKLIASLTSRLDGEGNAQKNNTALRTQIVNKIHLLYRLSEQCEKWYKYIANCPAGQFCKFKGWIKPDPDNKLPQKEVDEFGKFGVVEFYELEYAKPPKAWESIYWMYFLGFVQIGIGVLCALTGNFGLALPFLQCGIKDLFEATKAHIQNTVISWSKNLIDKILTYGPVFARLASSCLSTCKGGIGKFLYECANWLGLAKPLATSAVGMGAFVTKVIVSSCTAELKQFVFQKTGIPMPYLNAVEGLFRQGLAASLGRGSIQNVFKLGDNCWRDIFKGQINRQIAVVARKVFGDGDGFLKNLTEAACVRLVANKFEEKFDKIADKCYDGVLRTIQKTLCRQAKKKPLSEDAIKRIKKVLNDPLPPSTTNKRAELFARLRKLNLGREYNNYLEVLALRVSRNSGGGGPPDDGGGAGPPDDGGGAGPPDDGGGGPPDDGDGARDFRFDPVLLLTAPKKKYGLDCECVGIGLDGKDSMVARVSIVDENGDTVLDICVKPTQPIVNYRTEVSDIRPKDVGMGPGKATRPILSFADAQSAVKKLIPGNILIGHQLNKDLKYLKMDHPAELTRDSAKAKFLRERHGYGKNTPSLQKIYYNEFGVNMYKPGQEHDSVRDAKCSIQIYLKNIDEWEKEIRNEKREEVKSVKQGIKKKT
uniref:RNA exonuclease 4 n=1 Tax=Globodera rostochiensis TaxID=31243 RepID=A0A914HVP2_GLORO